MVDPLRVSIARSPPAVSYQEATTQGVVGMRSRSSGWRWPQMMRNGPSGPHAVGT